MNWLTIGMLFLLATIAAVTHITIQGKTKDLRLVYGLYRLVSVYTTAVLVVDGNRYQMSIVR